MAGYFIKMGKVIPYILLILLIHNSHCQANEYWSGYFSSAPSKNSNLSKQELEERIQAQNFFRTLPNILEEMGELNNRIRNITYTEKGKFQNKVYYSPSIKVVWESNNKDEKKPSFGCQGQKNINHDVVSAIKNIENAIKKLESKTKEKGKNLAASHPSQYSKTAVNPPKAIKFKSQGHLKQDFEDEMRVKQIKEVATLLEKWAINLFNDSQENIHEVYRRYIPALSHWLKALPSQLGNISCITQLNSLLSAEFAQSATNKTLKTWEILNTLDYILVESLLIQAKHYCDTLLPLYLNLKTSTRTFKNLVRVTKEENEYLKKILRTTSSFQSFENYLEGEIKNEINNILGETIHQDIKDKLINKIIIKIIKENVCIIDEEENINKGHHLKESKPESKGNNYNSQGIEVDFNSIIEQLGISSTSYYASLTARKPSYPSFQIIIPSNYLTEMVIPDFVRVKASNDNVRTVKGKLKGVIVKLSKNVSSNEGNIHQGWENIIKDQTFEERKKDYLKMPLPDPALITIKANICNEIKSLNNSVALSTSDNPLKPRRVQVLSKPWINRVTSKSQATHNLDSFLKAENQVYYLSNTLQTYIYYPGIDSQTTFKEIKNIINFYLLAIKEKQEALTKDNNKGILDIYLAQIQLNRKWLGEKKKNLIKLFPSYFLPAALTHEWTKIDIFNICNLEGEEEELSDPFRKQIRENISFITAISGFAQESLTANFLDIQRLVETANKLLLFQMHCTLLTTGGHNISTAPDISRLMVTDEDKLEINAPLITILAQRSSFKNIESDNKSKLPSENPLTLLDQYMQDILTNEVGMQVSSAWERLKALRKKGQRVANPDDQFMRDCNLIGCFFENLFYTTVKSALKKFNLTDDDITKLIAAVANADKQLDGIPKTPDIHLHFPVNIHKERTVSALSTAQSLPPQKTFERTTQVKLYTGPVITASTQNKVRPLQSKHNPLKPNETINDSIPVAELPGDVKQQYRAALNSNTGKPGIDSSSK